MNKKLIQLICAFVIGVPMAYLLLIQDKIFPKIIGVGILVCLIIVIFAYSNLEDKR